MFFVTSKWFVGQITRSYTNGGNMALLGSYMNEYDCIITGTGYVENNMHGTQPVLCQILMPQTDIFL